MNDVYPICINLLAIADQIGGKLKMDVDIGSMFEPLQAQGSTCRSLLRHDAESWPAGFKSTLCGSASGPR
jgi:hypothetical protein